MIWEEHPYRNGLCRCSQQECSHHIKEKQGGQGGVRQQGGPDPGELCRLLRGDGNSQGVLSRAVIGSDLCFNNTPLASKEGTRLEAGKLSRGYCND